MYKVNFACLFFGYLNRNSHAHEHFTCTGTLPVPVHRYRGILRSLINRVLDWAEYVLKNYTDKAFLARIILHSVSSYGRHSRPSTSLANSLLIRESEMYREENLLRHVAMEVKFFDLSKLWSCKNGRKKRKIWHVCLFCANDSSQDQSGSPCNVAMAVSSNKVCWDP